MSRAHTAHGAPAAVLLAGALILNTATAGPTPGPPARNTRDTPAAERLREMLGAINGGRPDQLRTVLTTRFAPKLLEEIPLEEQVRFLAELHERFGELTLERLESPDAEHARAVLRPSGSSLRRVLELEVEPAATHRVVNLDFRFDRPPRDPNAPPMSEADAVAELERYVEGLARSEDFSGAVLLARDGQVLLSRAYGEADKNFAVPNRVDTRFNLGSMNKMFTAVAITQLVERGKLSFDDPVSRYLPDLFPGGAGDRIRIKHLLTHTSGLGTYFTAEWRDASRTRYRTIDDYLPLIKKAPLAFEPGTSWSYSNNGFVVLGKIIERVSGQSYLDYVRDHIYKPVGMTGTDCYDMDVAAPRLAIGYQRQMTPAGPRWHNNLFEHAIRGGPAGGGYSTVEDLLRFDRALRGGKLVSKKSLELLFSPKPELNSPFYGYGFGVSGDGGVAGHSGGFTGISSNLDMFLKTGYTAVVLSNYSDASGPVTQEIRRLLARVAKSREAAAH